MYSYKGNKGNRYDLTGHSEPLTKVPVDQRRNCTILEEVRTLDSAGKAKQDRVEALLKKRISKGEGSVFTKSVGDDAYSVFDKLPGRLIHPYYPDRPA